jgi:hypothetical protein
MTNYVVSKQFAHFVQLWDVKAETEKEAWDKAESHGRLKYQTVYAETYPDRNYVTNLDDNIKNNTIPQDTYNKWLEEAIKLGMEVDGYCGLPFNDVY